MDTTGLKRGECHQPLKRAQTIIQGKANEKIFQDPFSGFSFPLPNAHGGMTITFPLR